MVELFEKGAKKVYPVIFPVQYGQLKSINCYLYDNGDCLSLIDAGIRTPEQKEYFLHVLKEFQLTIQDIDYILLTHHHEDHVGLVNDIIIEKDIPLYAHPLAICRLHFDEEFLNNRIKFFTKLYDDYGCLEIGKPRLEKLQRTILNREQLKIQSGIIPLTEGDHILGLEVFEVPGHSPDSIIFYDKDVKWQFSGDLVLEKASTNAIIDFDEQLNLLPTVAQYEQSLLKCKVLETDWVFSGHQSPFQQHELEFEQKLSRIKRKEQRVIDIVGKGYSTTEEIARKLYGRKIETEISLVLSEVIGYLRYAEDRGNIKKEMKNGEWHFYL